MFNEDCEPVTLNNKPMSCMLYADDLVLLSESSHGLQRCLNKLNEYCNTWKLTVNIDKTKIMIFNKTGKAVRKVEYMYGNDKLEVLMNIVI